MRFLIALVAAVLLVGACSSRDEETTSFPTATTQWDDVSFDDAVPDATEHDVGQLQAWYDQIASEIWSIPGVVYTDVQEAGAWIEIGADTDEARRLLRELFDRHGIPETAYRIPYADRGSDDDG